MKRQVAAEETTNKNWPLWGARYVSYTSRHLSQRVVEHRLQSSSMGQTHEQSAPGSNNADGK